MNKELFKSDMDGELQGILDSYDWQEAFKYCDYGTMQDIKRVIVYDNGYNEGPEWVGLFEMKNGKFVVLRASCDYTGWGCREGGSSAVYETLKMAVQDLGDDDRHRMNLKMMY